MASGDDKACSVESTGEDPIYTCAMDEDTGPARPAPWDEPMDRCARARGSRREAGAWARCWEAGAGETGEGRSRGLGQLIGGATIRWGRRWRGNEGSMWQISNLYGLLVHPGHRKRPGGHAPHAFTCHLAPPRHVATANIGRILPAPRCISPFSIFCSLFETISDLLFSASFSTAPHLPKFFVLLL